MTIRTFWDLSGAERAALTEDDVSRYCNIECMRRGVLPPVAPPPLAEIASAAPTGVPLYLVEARGKYDSYEVVAAFRTAEAANTFLTCADAVVFVSDYTSQDFFRPLGVDARVVVRAVPDEASRKSRKAESDRIAAVKAAHKAAEEEYDKAMTAVAKVTDPIWSTYAEERRLAARVAQVRKTWAEYLRMANDDPAVARPFLEKAFPPEHWDCREGMVNLLLEAGL